MCPACRTTAHFRIRRSIITSDTKPLPAVLAINAGVRTSDQLEVWQDGPSGEQFLKQRFGVITEGEAVWVVDEAGLDRSETHGSKALYELQGMVLQIQADGEGAHLVSVIRCKPFYPCIHLLLKGKQYRMSKATALLGIYSTIF